MASVLFACLGATGCVYIATSVRECPCFWCRCRRVGRLDHRICLGPPWFWACPRCVCVCLLALGLHLPAWSVDLPHWDQIGRCVSSSVWPSLSRPMVPRCAHTRPLCLVVTLISQHRLPTAIFACSKNMCVCCRMVLYPSRVAHVSSCTHPTSPSPPPTTNNIQYMTRFLFWGREHKQ